MLRIILPLFGIMFCLFPAHGCSDRDEGSRPNVIVLLVDTLRKDRLGAYGCTKGLTPCLDRIAEEGVCFRNAIAPASWTKPSVASLLTGLYPGNHGTILFKLPKNGPRKDGLFGLSDHHDTLAEKMKTVGYRTAAFITNPNLIPALHFDQGFDDFMQPAGDADGLLTRAADWISKRGGEDTFFLYLHLIDPHSSYYPPEAYRDKYVKTGPVDRAPFTNKGDFSEIMYWLSQYKKWRSASQEGQFEFDYEKIWAQLCKQYPGLSDKITLEQARETVFLDIKGYADPKLKEKADYLEALYDGEVAYTNDAIESFIAKLEGMGVLDDTVLVITADHGEAFLEHGTWGHHQTVHAPEVNIPLLFRIPEAEGRVQRQIDELVSLVDVYPTLLELSGIPLPRDLDGRSLMPLIQGKDANGFKNRPVYTELMDRVDQLFAVQVNDRKLIRETTTNGKVLWRCYDTVSDPMELNPLATTSEDRGSQALKQALEHSLKNRRSDFSPDEETTRMSREELEAMRKLGYL